MAAIIPLLVELSRSRALGRGFSCQQLAGGRRIAGDIIVSSPSSEQGRAGKPGWWVEGGGYSRVDRKWWRTIASSAKELSERPARSQTTFTPSLQKHVLSPRWRLTTTRCSGEATRPECADMRPRRSSSTASKGSLISFLGCLAAHRQESRRRQALNLARRARHVEAPAKDLSRPPGTLTKPPTSSYCLLMPLHDRGGPARSCSHRDSLWRGMA